MSVKKIDAALVRKCFLAGAAALQAKKEYINELNVFPVPDGDTGTNMTMTVMSAADEVTALDNLSMESICKAISSGSLRGARGNSGVILSQLFRGFTRILREVEEADVYVLGKAFEKAVDSAYKAVMKPKEGTILTVAKAGAEKAAELAPNCEDVEVFLQEVIREMNRTLEQTPEMLPVLKEAGVVDSGGKGLVTIMEGIMDAILGKEIVYESTAKPVAETSMTGAGATGIETENIKYGYCTEFIILLGNTEFTSEDEIELKKYLENIGDSIVCVADEEVVKIHVHTNDPGLAIQKGLTYGELTRMKIDNMREEHNERVIMSAEKAVQETAKEELEKMESAQEKPRKPEGFICVSAGTGLREIFTELGVDVIIEGGQTMNPSTEDILEAIDRVNADIIYIMPNNSNIILAANQAKSLTEDKKVVVIPTKNIPQGITAMIQYIDGNSPEENERAMTEALEEVRSGQVTYAVRDTTIDGKEIAQGDFMGLSDKTIEAVGKDIVETTVKLIHELETPDSSLITIYYGEEGSEEQAREIAEKICQENEELEVEIENGGQPVYYYFISVE
ncbi:MAG: DAK2 domain-containing protein [Eubacterium sp.]|nr:DAK2 domain-containing protein [Eubacterium sp.]